MTDATEYNKLQDFQMDFVNRKHGPFQRDTHIAGIQRMGTLMVLLTVFNTFYGLWESFNSGKFIQEYFHRPWEGFGVPLREINESKCEKEHRANCSRRNVFFSYHIGTSSAVGDYSELRV